MKEPIISVLHRINISNSGFPQLTGIHLPQHDEEREGKSESLVNEQALCWVFSGPLTSSVLYVPPASSLALPPCPAAIQLRFWQVHSKCQPISGTVFSGGVSVLPGSSLLRLNSRVSSLHSPPVSKGISFFPDEMLLLSSLKSYVINMEGNRQDLVLFGNSNNVWCHALYSAMD